MPTDTKRQAVTELADLLRNSSPSPLPITVA